MHRLGVLYTHRMFFETTAALKAEIYGFHWSVYTIHVLLGPQIPSPYKRAWVSWLRPQETSSRYAVAYKPCDFSTYLQGYASWARELVRWRSLMDKLRHDWLPLLLSHPKKVVWVAVCFFHMQTVDSWIWSTSVWQHGRQMSSLLTCVAEAKINSSMPVSLLEHNTR